jgi:hypothetical protein
MLHATMSSAERIKALCARAIEAEGADAEPALRELHAALKTHIEHLREMAATKLLGPQQHPPSDLPRLALADSRKLP